MALENSFSYVLTLSAFAVCTVSGSGAFGSAIKPSNLKILSKPCMDDLPYRFEATVSFSRCVFDCMSRSRCRSIMYRRLVSVCGFVDVDDTISLTATSGTEPVCLYTSVEGLDRSVLGACASHACSDRETCTLTESGQGYTCVKSECPNPPDIFNGHAVTNYQQVKGLVWYTCEPGLKTSGTRIRICQDNATWSEIDGGCGVICPEPKVIDTADLVSVVGERWRQNTVVTYQCKPGFDNGQGGNQINTTCFRNSRWKPTYIPCCKPGWKLINNQCYQFFDGSDVFSHEEMEKKCLDQHSWMFSAWGEKNINHVRDNVLKPYNITETIVNRLRMVNYKNRAIRCINSTTDIPIPDNILRGTYTEVYNFGLVNEVTCMDILSWAPEQPDLTYDCTALGQESGYMLRTIPCDWHTSGQYGFLCRLAKYI